VATERLGADRFRADQRLLAFEQNADAVTAHVTTASGTVTRQTGTALIGADGIHSWLRAQLHPDDGGIRWNGIQMWRGATDWPVWDGGDAMVIAGDAIAKLVLYPIAPGRNADTRLTNWVIYARAGDPAAPPPGRSTWASRAELPAFRHLVDRLDLPFIDVAALIGATAEIFEYPMCDRDPLPWWTQGRVTLLGDAAHPMYPVGSNGASQAILDARILARELATQPGWAAGLASYEALRRPATAAVVQANRGDGPDRVMDLVHGRAPEGFARLEDVVQPGELEAIIMGYKRTAGMDPATLNSRESWSVNRA
jgi:2-polyprenyl-6-methoxyphenol hydroxylase-like FAD-dependent oxidoreductase